MRTTIDLPDELLRRAKVAAAVEGVKLKDLMTRFVEQGLAQGSESVPRGHSRPVPVVIPARGRKIPALTNTEVLGILEKEDDRRHGRLT